MTMAQLTPGMLVERTYGEGRRPVGIVIAVPKSSRLGEWWVVEWAGSCLLYTSPSPRDRG